MTLRAQLSSYLVGGQAYEPFDEIVDAFREDQRGVVPQHGGRSPWQIVEHMRITIWDLYDFSTNQDGHYRDLKWPEEYWPPLAAPAPGQWEASTAGFKEARGKMQTLVLDESVELEEPFAWGEGQTLLREVLLAIDHAAYHLGELVELKRWLDAG